MHGSEELELYLNKHGYSGILAALNKRRLFNSDLTKAEIKAIQKHIESLPAETNTSNELYFERNNYLYTFNTSLAQYADNRKDGRDGFEITGKYNLKTLPADEKQILNQRIKSGRNLSGFIMLHGLTSDISRSISNMLVHGNKRTEEGNDNLDSGQLSEQSNSGRRDRRSGGDSQDSEISDLTFFTTPEGEVYGFVTKDGDIYLDDKVMTSEHPIHEFTHLWDMVIQKQNPALWARGVELMQQTSLWNEIANDANYGLKWQQAGIAGDKLTNLIASEVHARLSGMKGSEKIDDYLKENNDKPSNGFIARLKQWLSDFWKSLKNTFSKWTQQDLSNLTAEDFAQMSIRDLFTGALTGYLKQSKDGQLSNYLRGEAITLQQRESRSPVATVQYTLTGQSTPNTYKVIYDNGKWHIYNNENKEVFKEDATNAGKDRNLIIANACIGFHIATEVSHNGRSYVVYNNNAILSCTSGEFMQRGEDNGDRRAILEAAHKKAPNIGWVDQQQQQQPQTPQQSNQTINIWAGSNSHTELSNLAHRPFEAKLFREDNKPFRFNSVEQLFQAAKAFAYGKYLGVITNNSDIPGLNNIPQRPQKGTKDQENAVVASFSNILSAKDGFEAKRLGSKNGGLVIDDANFLDNIWGGKDGVAEQVMRYAIRESFSQNPAALQQLLATGNATLTHNEDKGQWREAFPRILMEARSEFQQQNTISNNQSSSNNINNNNYGTNNVQSGGLVQSTVSGNLKIHWQQERGRGDSARGESKQPSSGDVSGGIRGHDADVANQVSQVSDTLDKALADVVLNICCYLFKYGGINIRPCSSPIPCFNIS